MRGHRVLLIDQASTFPLQLCRALARRGVVVDVVAEAMAPLLCSRYPRRRVAAPPWHDDRFLQILQAAVEATAYDAIYMCSEVVLERALPLITASPGWGALPLPVREDLLPLFSKNAVCARVRAAGVPVPDTVVPADAGEVEGLSRQLRLPIVVKGEKGEAAHNVRIAHTWEEVLPAYRDVEQRENGYGGRPALQEFVPGPSYLVGGLVVNGRVARLCAHRKVVMVPPSGGVTVRGITERPPRLVTAALGAFEALRYHGLGSLDFVLDRRDGRFKFLEINPRVWATVGLSLHCTDFLTPYHDLAQGRIALPDLRYREGLVYHRIPGELRLMARRPSRVLGFIRDCLDPRVRSDLDWTDLPAQYSRARRRPA